MRSSIAAARFVRRRGWIRGQVACRSRRRRHRDRHAASRRRRIRVTTQLTDAVERHAAVVPRSAVPVGDLFQVQDELTQRIVASLSLPLTAREQQHAPARRAIARQRAYEYFLRGNQLSHDAKQWSVARDLYLRCVEEDPRYAPAWARLGRIHHVMAKYLETGKHGGVSTAPRRRSGGRSSSTPICRSRTSSSPNSRSISAARTTRWPGSSSGRKAPTPSCWPGW